MKKKFDYINVKSTVQIPESMHFYFYCQAAMSCPGSLTFNLGIMSGPGIISGPGTRFSKAQKLFGPLEPFLVHLYLKTENDVYA